MPFEWYKNFLNKAKSYKSLIGDIESNYLDERKQFKDIFERNIVLEREITERTDELNQANRSLLTLKHIWSTMNSSEPLSEVLSTVVKGLSDELDYIFCCIYQLVEQDGNAEIRPRAVGEGNITSKVNNILELPFDSYSISMENKDNIVVQAILEQKIKNTRSFKNILTGGSPDIDLMRLEKLDLLFGGRSVSVLPIVVQEKPFGSLVIVSIRNELSDTERNFLSLFVGQIELAVTIAGLFEQIREQAITDGLTGLFNRRHFDQCLGSEADRALRLKQPFTLITLDLDHLKFINDTYGHPAGDNAICHIGRVLKANARSVDIPSRYGGEEFALILPGIDLDGGLIAAERLRSAIAEVAVENVGKVTASIGVATFLRHTESLTELLELADQALYRAKRNGRNQVQIAQKEEQTDWQLLALDAFIDILTKRRIPVSPNIANELTQKLKTTPVQDKNLIDFLYFIVDLLSKTYTPAYEGNYTREKSETVCELAKNIGLPEDDMDKLVLATLLYDLGNLMMPEHILLKPGPLTDDEKSSVKKHPIITAREILKPIKMASPIVSMIEHYSEHWDGSGYPGLLAGEEIPVGSRIISIVSAYYAMMSDRPYRKALSHDEAVDVLRKGAGSTWDEKIIDAFIILMDKETKAV